MINPPNDHSRPLAHVFGRNTSAQNPSRVALYTLGMQRRLEKHDRYSNTNGTEVKYIKIGNIHAGQGNWRVYQMREEADQGSK